MALRRLSLLSVLSVCALFVGCKSDDTTTPPSEPSTQFVITRAAGGPATPLPKGSTVTLNIQASVIQADNTETPIVGHVSLSVTRGSLADNTVTLVRDGAYGKASFDLTLCSSTDADCVARQRTVVTAKMTTPAGEEIETSYSIMIQEDPAASCDKNDANICQDTACAGAACLSDVGDGICDKAQKACVIPPPGDGVLSLGLTFSYLPGSANAGNKPSIVALPKGSEPILVTAQLTKLDSSSSIDISTLKLRFALTASVAGVSPGALHPFGVATTTQVLETGVENGVGTAVFDPSTVPASGTLTVTVLNADGSERNLKDPRPINVVVPGALVFGPLGTDPYYRTLGIRGSGFQEQSVLRFALLDSAGNRWRPSLGAVTVNFQLTNKAGDMSLSPLVATVDSKGEVTTTVYSGTTVSNSAVKAVATIGNTPLQTNSEILVVVGAKPSSNNFNVACDKSAIDALVGNDCSVMRQDLAANCTAVLLDRFNNPVGRRVRVSWATEAGSIGQPSSTPLANPDDPSTADLGKAQNSIRTLSGRMPLDVDPLPGSQEPNTLGDGSDVCAKVGQTRVYNPRDGLVTFIAYTQGEEWFDDRNKNGKQDGNEAFDDLAEPFVDANDNNQFDPGEDFIDTNGNGHWDPADGVWNEDTVIWTTGHVVFTGTPKATVAVDGNVDLKALENSQVVTMRYRWEDLNGNEPASATAAYAAALLSGDGTAAQTSPDKYPDRFGSMQIRTTRKASNVGASTVYSYQSEITYDVAPQQTVVYTAPPPEYVTDASGTVYAVLTKFAASVAGSVSLGDVGSFVSTTRELASAPFVCLNRQGQPATNSLKDAECNYDACSGAACRTAGGADGTCQRGTCNPGTVGTTSYVMDVTYTTSTGEAASSRIIAGSSNVTVTAKVTDRTTGGAAAGVTLTFDTSNSIGLVKVGAGAAATSVTAVTDASGVATATFIPGSVPAKGNLTVTIDGFPVRRLIDIVVAGVMQFSPAPTDGFVRVMGVTSSGWREQNVLRFKLLDSVGQPYLGEAEVQFSVSPLGGAKVVPDKLKIDSNGEVVTQLYSGVQAGTLAVTATTVVNGKTLTIQSDTIAVVGAKANGRNFALRCDTLAVPAFLSNDCSYTHSDFTASCTAVLGDRFNNTLGRDTRVTWLSEAGLFGPPSSTPLAAPDADPAGQGNLGRTINTLRTLNTPLPLDVAPSDSILPGESGRATSLTGACPRTGNPRDGLVTLLASTQGEEGFVDTNNNGKWDSGEKFYDLGEPYVDANDDGAWNAGELYIDVDGNGTYTAANGVWDANTTIWTTSYVAYTGIASPTFDFPSNPSNRTTPPFADYDTSFNFTVDWRDENGNEPAPTFSSYGLGAAPGNGTVQILSGTNRLDQVGSMYISRPTVCGYDASHPNACKLTTSMALNSRVLTGRYSAPTTKQTPPNPLGDSIIASVTSPDGALGDIVMSGSVDVPTAALPVVSSLSPSGGPVGTLFAINGTRLNGVGSAAYFRDSSNTVYQLALQAIGMSSQLSVKVPATATPGNATVWVENAAGISGTLTFVVGDAPTITSFTPATGVPGQARVTVYGGGFDVTGLKIFIGNTQIEPPVSGPSVVFYQTADQVRFLVPVGVRTGKITIVTAAGSVTSAGPFTVPAPTILTDFAALGTVNVGDTITVTGTNFDVGGLLVDVGGVLVPSGGVTNVTNNSFDFVVPVGASTGFVTVSTNGGSIPGSTPLTVN
jgi:hypothetical protein